MDAHYKERKAGEKFTLSESKTKLYLHMKTDKLEVKVDDGIVKAGTRKCDYLLYDDANKQTYLIELKGTVIDRAYSQLAETISVIGQLPSEKYLLENLDELKAYIVSPAPKVPKNVSTRERALAKILAKKCTIKPENMLNLIVYVKVVKKVAGAKLENRKITISGNQPLFL